MDSVQTVFLSVSTMALCTIVGIYYIWVRKLPQVGHRVARQQ